MTEAASAAMAAGLLVQRSGAPGAPGAGTDGAMTALVEAMNQGAAMLGPDGAISYANPRLATLLCTARAALAGQCLRDFVAAADRAGFDALFEHAGQEACAGELWLTPPGTAPVPVEIALSAFPHGAGVSQCAVVTDLTRRKRAEDALRHAQERLEHRVAERTTELAAANQRLDASRRAALNLMEDAVEARKQAERAREDARCSEERLRRMAETIGDVFWLASGDGRTILYVSPAFETIWGHPCAALIERPALWIECIDPAHREQVAAENARLAAGQAYDVEYRIVRPDGSFRWIHDHGQAVLDSDGRITMRSGVATDMTALVTLQEALARADRTPQA